MGGGKISECTHTRARSYGDALARCQGLEVTVGTRQSEAALLLPPGSCFGPVCAFLHAQRGRGRSLVPLHRSASFRRVPASLSIAAS